MDQTMSMSVKGDTQFKWAISITSFRSMCTSSLEQRDIILLIVWIPVVTIISADIPSSYIWDHSKVHPAHRFGHSLSPSFTVILMFSDQEHSIGVSKLFDRSWQTRMMTDFADHCAQSNLHRSLESHPEVISEYYVYNGYVYVGYIWRCWNHDFSGSSCNRFLGHNTPDSA